MAKATRDRWLDRGLWDKYDIYGPRPMRWWHRIIFWRPLHDIVIGQRTTGYDHTRRTAAPAKKKARLVTQASRRANR